MKFVFQITVILLTGSLQYQSVQGFMGADPTAFIAPSRQFFADQCAKHGVTFDDELLEETAECLKPITAKLEEVEFQKKWATICQHTKEMRICYTKVFDVIERCVPAWVENDKIFKPVEIFDNIEKAFCPETLTSRVSNVINLSKTGRNAVLCGMKHYKAIGDDLFGCPAVLQVLLDPENLTGTKICGIIDSFEKCLLSTLDLCGENVEQIETFVRQVYDVLISMIFKCDSHQNF